MSGERDECSDGASGRPSGEATADGGLDAPSDRPTVGGEPRLQAVGRRIATTVGSRVAVDLRAVAALRITLGLLLVADYLGRARWLTVFYTDASVLPRATLQTVYPTVSGLSVHALWGGVLPQAALFLVGVVSAIAFAAGYRSRTAAVVSWLLLVSLHARNPVVLNGGDSLLRRTLLWAVFLPTGARWSVDAAVGRARRWTDGDRLASPATAALVVQPVIVYATNAVVKLRGDAWPTGRAIHTVFGLSRFTTPAGEVVAGADPLVSALGWGWLALLVVSPALLVCSGRRRTVFATALAAGHLGMLATMRLGLFPLIAVAALLPLVDAGIWNRVETVVGRQATPETSPGRRRRRLQAAGRAVVVVLLVVAAGWNALALGAAGVDSRADAHRWDMFAPEPPTERLWVVAVGSVDDRRVVVYPDARGRPTSRPSPDTRRSSTSRPPPSARTAPVWFDRPTTAYPTVRWRKFLVSVAWSRDPALERGLAAGLCNQFDRRHETTLDSVVVSVVTEPVGGGVRERREIAAGRCERLSSRPVVPS